MASKTVWIVGGVVVAAAVVGYLAYNGSPSKDTAGTIVEAKRARADGTNSPQPTQGSANPSDQGAAAGSAGNDAAKAADAANASSSGNDARYKDASHPVDAVRADAVRAADSAAAASGHFSSNVRADALRAQDAAKAMDASAAANGHFASNARADSARAVDAAKADSAAAANAQSK